MSGLNSRRLMTALGVCVAMTFGAVSLAAQPAPRPLPGNPAYQGQNQPDRNANRREARIDGRLAYLHDRLGITPAQQRAWDNFAAQLRGDMGARPQAPRPQARANQPGAGPGGRPMPPDILDRLQRREDALARQHDRLDHLMAALRPLYASLSPEQKRIADRELLAAQRRAMRGRFSRFAQRGGFRQGPGGFPQAPNGRFGNRNY